MKAYQAFNKQFSKKSLRKKYEEHTKNTSATGHDGKTKQSFEKELNEETSIILRKCHNNTYSFTPYKEKLLAKGADKLPRQISIPTFRDRLTLKALLDSLSDTFPEIRTEIPQSKIANLKTEISKNRWNEFAKIDIKNFYPSINHDILISKLSNRIRKRQFRSLIEKAIKTPTCAMPPTNEVNKKGVPQGLPISNFLAEIYLHELAEKIKPERDFYFDRYVDDCLILAKKGEAKEVADQIISELKDLGLEAHPPEKDSNKTKYGKISEDSFTYLGYNIDKGTTTVGMASKNKLESSIAAILTTGKHKLRNNPKSKTRTLKACEWRLNLRITGCIFHGKRMGWLFYYSQIEDRNILYRIDKTVENLLEKSSLSGQISPKKLSRTFHETTRKNLDNHQYIPNLDTLSVSEKSEILSYFIGKTKVKNLDKTKIEKYFEMKVSHVVKELEEDILNFS